MAQPATSAFGLASLFDPSIAADQAALDRQMALAQTLRSQALSPLDTSGRQVGGMGYRISPLEGLAKMAQGYVASQLDKQNDMARQALAQRSLAAMVDALRNGGPLGGASSGSQPVPVTGLPPDPNAGAPASGGPLPATPTQTQPGAPAPSSQPSPAPDSAPQPQGAGNEFGPGNLIRGAIVGALGGDPAAAAYWKRAAPELTDVGRLLHEAGIDPNSPVGKSITMGAINKTNFIPPTSLRPGGAVLDNQTGNITTLPASAPSGFQNVRNPDGSWAVVPVSGGPGAVAASTASEAAGRAVATPFSGVDQAGRPTPVTNLANALRLNVPGFSGAPPAPSAPSPAPSALPPGSQIPPDVQAKRDDIRRQILADELRREPDPKNRAAIQQELDAMGPSTSGSQGAAAPASGSGAVYSQPPLGTESAQKGLDTSWEALKAANREASNTRSYLGNIVKAAEQGAIVGPGADKREFIQGILQLAGIKESVNANAVTQKQLLDKYHDQIVTRLGQGGLGTDAARAMLDSAYPGSHMNMDAIREAASNLSAAQDMTQAKARFLLDPAQSRNTQEYQKRELMFDQAADPTVFQALAIRDPKARRAFVQDAMQRDPTFGNRVKQLKAMGAVQ